MFKLANNVPGLEPIVSGPANIVGEAHHIGFFFPNNVAGASNNVGGPRHIVFSRDHIVGDSANNVVSPYLIVFCRSHIGSAPFFNGLGRSWHCSGKVPQ